MDRWLEIDIDWFGDPPWDRTIDQFVERTLPLLTGEHELRGVCFNVGWLADLVTEWSGRPEQPLPLRSRRFARWARLSYEDLRRFLGQVRRSAAAAGIDDLKLGVLVAGLGEVVAPPVTGTMYDLFSDWHDRHPELYPLDISPLPGPDLDPRVPMHADDHLYATRAHGIAEGEPFPEFFGGQWGSVAGFLGLDLIHLRDGFLGPLLYTRVGPYGTVASDDPAENATWTDAVRRLFRACKEAHPGGLVMAYSSGISGTAEWLTGCVDLEAIVADGALDIFIDQTWGGAWQDWWDDTWKGWTFQLAYLLGHGAQIRGGNERRTTPCRQYNLIETWDGWEPWDTLHDTPGKLEWAIWAFSHAGVLGPDGRPRVPEGTYISWMNDWNGRLISETDVRFLARPLDAAQASASAIEQIFGPLLVHDRDGLEAAWREAPAANTSPWAEDHAGMALKFGARVPGRDPSRVAAGPLAGRGPVAAAGGLARGSRARPGWSRDRHGSRGPDRRRVARRSRPGADRRPAARRLPPGHAGEPGPAPRGAPPSSRAGGAACERGHAGRLRLRRNRAAGGSRADPSLAAAGSCRSGQPAWCPIRRSDRPRPMSRPRGCSTRAPPRPVGCRWPRSPRTSR